MELPISASEPMQADRRHARALRHRAKQLIVRRRFNEAAALLTEGVKHFPDCYKLRRLRSMAYACAHDYVTSRTEAERVIELAPNAPDGFYFKGENVLSRRGCLENGN